MWFELFDDFLNIPDCGSLPAWSRINAFIGEQLRAAVESDPLEWRRALERYTTTLKTIAAGAQQ